MLVFNTIRFHFIEFVLLNLQNNCTILALTLEHTVDDGINVFLYKVMSWILFLIKNVIRLASIICVPTTLSFPRNLP